VNGSQPPRSKSLNAPDNVSTTPFWRNTPAYSVPKEQSTAIRVDDAIEAQLVPFVARQGVCDERFTGNERIHVRTRRVAVGWVDAAR